MPLDVSMLRLLSQEQLTTLLRHIPGDKDMASIMIRNPEELSYIIMFLPAAKPAGQQVA